MKKKRLKQVEREIEKIKRELNRIGRMRPGSLTVQYRDPEKKIGPFHQISYTHHGKSRTEYVRPPFLKDIRAQINQYKKFRSLIERWVDLSIERSKLEIEIAKEETGR